jgi:sugar phosphate isomerase/epimerase
MAYLLLNTIALEPNRWSKEKIPHGNLEQLLEPITGGEFHFIEVWQYHISRESEMTVRRIRDLASSIGVSIRIVGMYPQLHLSGENRRREIDVAERIFSYANILGAHAVKVFVGSQGAAKLSLEDYKTSVQTMKQLARQAQTLGLIITGETHQNTLFETTDSTQKFLSEVGEQNFKVCFQPFDLHDTEKALCDYEVIAEHVVHVHYQGRRDKQMDLLEYSDIDYSRLTHALAQHGFEGDISIEFVKDCIAKDVTDFDLNLVLRNAQRDRRFILKTAASVGLEVLG